MNALSANVAWSQLISTILVEGEVVAPRGLPCCEILGYQSRIDMMSPVLVCPPRKISYRFMCGEAWWITSGRNDAESIVKYAKNIARYSDNGTSFFGAYGPMLHEQLGYVVETLLRDPDSRQAVINIWRERPPKTADCPCTLSWQFLLRKDRLHLNATMRSSDAWLGWPYDVFNFSMVAWLVTKRLGPWVTPGILTLTAGSQHIYESDMPGIERVLSERWGTDDPELDLRDVSDVVSELRIAAEQDWALLEVESPFRLFERLSAKRT